MKKIIPILIVVLIIVFATILLICFLTINRCEIDSIKTCKVTFVHNCKEISADISYKEMEIIDCLFSGKILYADEPSCGFSEEVSIKINGSETFCVARDGCPIVYWKEKDRYFRLDEGEKVQLHLLLESYGFLFPCV